MSLIVDFYLDREPTATGIYFRDFLAMTDAELESCHDFIQWVFPLTEPSRFNLNAPLLTERDITEFKTRPSIGLSADAAFLKMMEFYGLGYGNRLTVNPNKWPNWITLENHNFLRLTRILKFMMLIGRVTDAYVLFNYLSILYFTGSGEVISEKTFQFWKNSLIGYGNDSN